MTQIRIKRAYEAAEPGDGYRVYIDRLWPRGLSHETFHYDVWDKDLAPTTELREWFHAAPLERWPEFERRYSQELDNNAAFEALKSQIRGKETVTLLFSSKDENHNNAVVVRNKLIG